jgi:hypothetical protein
MHVDYWHGAVVTIDDPLTRGAPIESGMGSRSDSAHDPAGSFFAPARLKDGVIGSQQHAGDNMNYTTNDPNDFMAIGAALVATLLCGLILLF